MPLKNQPCAYCGSIDTPRLKGHVISRNLFPETLPDNVQRITVPECKRCKASWEDAETQFRNIMMAIWDSEKVVKDNRFYSMARSFQKPDGRRRWRDLFNQIVPVNTSSGKRDAIYPAKDPSCNLIFRRIVRGLSYHHNLGSAIPDKSVVTGAMIYDLPPAFEQEMNWHQMAPDFFRYGYALINEDGIHSFWILHFSNHIKIFGLITSQHQ